MKKMMIRALVLGTVAAFCITADAAAQGSLSVGDKAPEFPNPLPSSAGEKPGAVKIQLADYLGKKNIVLAFYVADWTGG